MGYPKFEYKYLYPKELYEPLRRRIERMCPLDPHAAREKTGRYTIRSVYFDSLRFHTYDDKIEGVHKRRKFRIRVYGLQRPDSVAFLEIKQKTGALLTKYRAPVLYDDLPALFSDMDYMQYVRDGRGAGIDRGNARHWMYHYITRKLCPVVLVDYERTAFAGEKSFDLRITLDSDIRGEMFPSLTGMFNEEGVHAAMPGMGILEVKFTHGIPLWMRNIIRSHDLQRLALSKYTICVDALRHDARHQRRAVTVLDRSERTARHLASVFAPF